MAERNPQIPDLGEMLGLPAEDLQRPQTRGDLLDYYLGPTGVPDRLAAANELLNPIRGLSDAMYYAGEAARPGSPNSDRAAAAGQSALETGIALLPVGVGKIAGRYMRSMPDADPNNAQAVIETLTGGTPDISDPSRRNFMKVVGAAAVAPMLPAEELLGAATKASARGAGAPALGELLAKLQQASTKQMGASTQLRSLDQILRGMGPSRNQEDLLATPEGAERLQAIRNLEGTREGINAELAAADTEVGGIRGELADALLGSDSLEDALAGLDPAQARSVLTNVDETLVARASRRAGGTGSMDMFEEIYDAAQANNKQGLVDAGLTEPEADLYLQIKARAPEEDTTQLDDFLQGMSAEDMMLLQSELANLK